MRSSGRAPYEGYQLSNLGARIKADEARIEQIKRRKLRTQEAEAAGGVMVQHPGNGTQASVTFAEKPAREILQALRDSGYWWCGSYWIGPAEKLPDCVRKLSEASAGPRDAGETKP